MIFYRQQVPMRHSLKSSERFRTIPGAAALILAICSIHSISLGNRKLFRYVQILKFVDVFRVYAYGAS